MPRLPALYLTWYGILWYTLTIFRNQRPKVWERIHLCQLLFILNEYATRYAIAGHYLGLVDIDE